MIKLKKGLSALAISLTNHQFRLAKKLKPFTSVPFFGVIEGARTPDPQNHNLML